MVILKTLHILAKIFHFLNYYFTQIYRNLKEPGAVTESSEVVKENSFTNVIPSSEHPVDV